MPYTTLLRDVFGFDAFRPGQEEIVRVVAEGQNVLAIMPTGSGKSLCFQLPAIYLEGTAIVISPLIALMKDQVDALRANGIKTAFFNSSQPQEEQQQTLQDLKKRTAGPRGVETPSDSFPNFAVAPFVVSKCIFLLDPICK